MKILKDKIFAIDFDGTCVTHEYPSIGKDIGAIPVLKRIIQEGGKLILWTMRSDSKLAEAIAWFHNNEIQLYGCQVNPTQHLWTSSRKAYAHVYIDDAALSCPLIHDQKISDRPFVDWNVIEKMLFSEQE